MRRDWLQSEAVTGNAGWVRETQVAGRSREVLGDADHSRLRVRLTKSSKPSAPINHGLTAPPPPPPPPLLGAGVGAGAGAALTVNVAAELYTEKATLVTTTV